MATPAAGDSLPPTVQLPTPLEPTPTPTRPVSPSAVATQPTSSVPHIDLGGGHSSEEPEWFKWALLVIMAAIGAALALALMPYLK